MWGRTLYAADGRVKPLVADLYQRMPGRADRLEVRIAGERWRGRAAVPIERCEVDPGVISLSAEHRGRYPGLR